MYFECQKEWEVDLSPITQIFGDDGKRCFPIVELAYNFRVFILDVRVHYEDGEGSHINRYFFGSVTDLFASVDQPGISEFRISLLSRRCDNNGEYSVADIREICEAKNAADQRVFVYRCMDGKQYVDSSLGNSRCSHFKFLRSVSLK